MWIDTHEHLVEERLRLRGEPYVLADSFGGAFEGTYVMPDDWSVFLCEYAFADLACAGMPEADLEVLFGATLDARGKWDLAAPFVERSRNTGYIRTMDVATEQLTGLRLSADTCVEVDRGLRALREPGYYRHLLRDVARVERCHVNSAEDDPMRETATPDLFDQDLSLMQLVRGFHHRAEELSGIEVTGLDSYVDVIEWCFAEFGPRAVAVKCQWAYVRPLAVERRDPPDRAFERVRAGAASAEDRRAVEDHLFTLCVELAAERGLPVKIHMGYVSDSGRPELRHVRDHVHDMTAVVQAHPNATFVLMHIAWPHQEELLALAKHQPNVVVDLCWAWILAPLSTRDFVQRFLTTVPANKLLCFGGDHLAVENVVGHAEIARRGLEGALAGLVDDDWLTEDEALALVPALMRTNAERLFPLPLRETPR